MKRVLSVLALLALVATASATTIIHDDFESYADTAALNAVWPIGSGSATTTFLDVGSNGPTLPGNQCVQNIMGSAGRRDFTFTPVQVGAGQELVWAYDFYDSVGGTNSVYRQYGQLLSKDPNNALNELIAVGAYIETTKPGVTFDPNAYQARIALTTGQGWFNLAARRSIGWHRFEMHIWPTSVDFYVDGALDTANLPMSGTNWYQARIGSGLATGGGMAKYDNYDLALVPEPAALSLLALGGLALLRRRG